MDIESRLNLIKEVGEEIVTEEDLRNLLETKNKPVAYNGFEPSGQVHIAQGIIGAFNANKLIKAGVKFKMFSADYHAWANNKLGGDLEKIQKCGDYLTEIWKAAGMDLKNTEFVKASEIADSKDYWKKVLEISKISTIKRIIRTGQIMGRKESEVQQASQILYPCMQAADIFELGADICQLGMDQRKVNILAREVGPAMGLWKPIIVSHHMLLGLQHIKSMEKNSTDRAIDMKMSKSKPDSAIFMTDSEDDVNRKIKKAYCPETIEENPVLEYIKYIAFEKFKKFIISTKSGKDLEFETYNEFEKAYSNKEVHPMDVKESLTEAINNVLDPIRKHFSKGKPKAILDEVKSFEVTR